jgi:hypothetical protein
LHRYWKKVEKLVKTAVAAAPGAERRASWQASMKVISRGGQPTGARHALAKTGGARHATEKVIDLQSSRSKHYERARM